MGTKSGELVLREKIQGFVRAFGLLRNQTPCGKPISVSMAHALMHLRGASESCSASQSTLQRTLSLDRSNVTRLCMGLEEAGFVTQHSSEEDGRVRVVSLTKKGERLADSLLTASQRRFGEILARIPKGRHAQVFGALDLLTNAILTATSPLDAQ
jgi:DNA-binding MarR family transcriptional regulator